MDFEAAQLLVQAQENMDSLFVLADWYFDKGDDLNALRILKCEIPASEIRLATQIVYKKELQEIPRRGNRVLRWLMKEKRKEKTFLKYLRDFHFTGDKVMQEDLELVLCPLEYDKACGVRVRNAIRCSHYWRRDVKYIPYGSTFTSAAEYVERRCIRFEDHTNAKKARKMAAEYCSWRYYQKIVLEKEEPINAPNGSDR